MGHLKSERVGKRKNYYRDQEVENGAELPGRRNLKNEEKKRGLVKVISCKMNIPIGRESSKLSKRVQKANEPRSSTGCLLGGP